MASTIQILTSHNPATDKLIWEGETTSAVELQEVIAKADAARFVWANMPFEGRCEICLNFKAAVAQKKEFLAHTISEEMGKPLWESQQEVNALISKIDITISAYQERCPDQTKMQGEVAHHLSHRPHGILAVLAPFNFPMHLPNGHIAPALLAGNCVILKPSEFAPKSGQELVDCWNASGLPDGVLQIVQGRGDIGRALAEHPQIDGLCFTGSSATGKSLMKLFSETPGKLLALEMGGNNPLVVSENIESDAAVFGIVQSAFLTTGQRCSCARRLIIIDSPGRQRLLDRLVEVTKRLKVGAFDATPAPYMGPLIHRQSRESALNAQEEWSRAGAKCLLKMSSLGEVGAFVSPGVFQMDSQMALKDEEVFAPLLAVYVVQNLDEAIALANRTRYGLSATIFTDSAQEYKQFFREVRAGLINWNTPTTGASSEMPFGGIGDSGNLRPSGYYAVDYSVYPVASMERESLVLPGQLPAGIELP
ncbi:MAG: succinylglutamate-semialdehyde dehydrogenase [Chlamydiia bacterium]|nr:succinylglutamate-semialdehyde dehydrogenase [Chlamydiia bacterium]